MEVFIGIDPGLHGGLAIIETSGLLVEMMPMPLIDGELDHFSVAKIFKDWMFEYQVKLVVVEQLSCRPGQNVMGVMKSGKNYGILLGVLESIGASYIEVRPQDWMKSFPPITKFEKKPDKRRKLIKARNAEIAKKLFKGEKFTIGIRSTKPHDGIVDAVLLAKHAFNRWHDRKKTVGSADWEQETKKRPNLFGLRKKPISSQN